MLSRVFKIGISAPIVLGIFMTIIPTSTASTASGKTNSSANGYTSSKKSQFDEPKYQEKACEDSRFSPGDAVFLSNQPKLGTLTFLGCAPAATNTNLQAYYAEFAYKGFYFQYWNTNPDFITKKVQ